MSPKILLVTILLTLIAGIAIGAGGYYYISTNPSPLAYIQNQNKEEVNTGAADEAAKKAAAEKEINAMFPDLVKGTILISANESTLKTADNKTYLLWPMYSAKYYTDSGLSNNQQVELQGKIIPKDDKFKRDRLFLKPLTLNP